MKIKKNKIIVQDEQQIEESAVDMSNAPFSQNEQETQGVQIGIEEALSEATNEKKLPVVNEQDQLNNVEETVAKQKTKKKRWTNAIFMMANLIIVAIIIITQVKDNNMVPLSEIISSGINWWFLLLCVVVYGLVTVFEGARVDVFVHDSTKKRQFGLSYRTAMIGRYYDCITPLASGGQPFQIYYLKKYGLTAAQSIAVPMGKYVFHKITSVIIYTVVIFSTVAVGMGEGIGTTVVSAAGWVGYAIQFSLIFLVMLLSVNRKIGTSIVGWFIKIGHKLKLVKNYDKTYNSVIKVVDDFQSAFKYYVKSPKTFIKSVILAAANLILYYTIPFVIYCTFAGYESGLWASIFVKCVMIDLAASFIPLPGGSGVAELSFTTLFASLFVGGRLFWALLLWRILTYYGYILQGLVIMVYDYTIGDKKYFWIKRKNELELESEKFKAEQLSEFKNKKIKKPKK